MTGAMLPASISSFTNVHHHMTASVALPVIEITDTRIAPWTGRGIEAPCKT
jgi:hypothetical protein